MSCIGNRCSCENAWNKLAYKEEPFTSLGEMPAGGSWPLNYFRRREDGGFETITGEKIAFKIKTPDYFDKLWQNQLSIVINACTQITEEEKKMAIYWGKGEPSNQLEPILQTLINTYGLQVVEAFRLHYIVQSALNDAAILCWHFKYAYQIPRPVQYCQGFESFLPTPQHPSYPAGHSVMPACFIKIVSHFFPAEKEKLYQLLEVCSGARLYAGVHYPLDISEGNKLGEDIGEKILKIMGEQSDKYGAWIDRIHTEFKDAPIMPIYK